MPARRMRKQPPTLTIRDLKQRARAAGVTLPEDAWEPMATVMNGALEPLRSFDTVAERPLEPAVIFKG